MLVSEKEGVWLITGYTVYMLEQTGWNRGQPKFENAVYIQPQIRQRKFDTNVE